MARNPEAAGETPRRFAVPAAAHNVATVKVEAGETWRFSAAGCWRDAIIPCGPDGYRCFPWDVLEFWPRIPDENWFCLIGVVDGDDSTAFAIGSGCEHQFEKSGELSVFANDQAGRYKNNYGCVELVMERVREPAPAEGLCPAADPPTFAGRLADFASRAVSGWRWLRAVLDQTAGILFVAGIVVGVSLILLLLPQGRDLILSVGEDKFWPPNPQTWRQISFGLGLLFMAIQAWFWPRAIIESNYGRDRVDWNPQWLLVWGPRALAVAPFLLVGLALESNAAPNTGFVAALLVVAVLLLAYLIKRNDIEDGLRSRIKKRLLFSRTWAIFGFVFAAVSMLVAIVWRVAPAQFLGPPSVVFLGVGLLIPVVVFISQLGADFRLPLFSGTLIAAVIFSLWMDNHAVGRRLHPHDPPAAQQISLDQAYAAWKAQAPHEGSRYPMVLVASEGGASRAGFWTAESLAALRKVTNGKLDRSLFAISSVSGGSVGAVGFVAGLKENPSVDSDKLEGRLNAFVGRDALSPALGGLLFPDLLQRFIPVAFLPDRAEALEEAWEQGWRAGCARGDKTCTRGLMKAPFLGLWDDFLAAGWKRPLVIVDGANEESGRPILTSKIRIDPDVIDADDFYGRNNQNDVHASTAIHNGARFPWISPAGLLPKGGHILDGGYFDTAGVETVRELARAIKAGPGRDDDLQFIVVFIDYKGPDKAKPPPPPTSARLFNEVMAPLLGIFASRDAHGDHMMVAVRQDLADSLPPAGSLGASAAGASLPATTSTAQIVKLPPSPASAPPVALGPLKGVYVQLMLCDAENFQEPLDWTLSQKAQTFMRRAAGFAPQNPCPDQPGGLANGAALSTVRDLLAAAEPTPAVSAAPR